MAGRGLDVHGQSTRGPAQTSHALYIPGKQPFWPCSSLRVFMLCILCQLPISCGGNRSGLVLRVWTLESGSLTRLISGKRRTEGSGLHFLTSFWLLLQPQVEGVPLGTA